MSTVSDPLLDTVSLDRVFYATGVLLAADDFSAEQSYHRGRLARALAYLFGSGTVAGLRVDWKPALPPSTELPDGQEELLQVHPGLAIDRIGRIIEVPRAACLRLGRWYDGQDPGELAAGLHPTPWDGVVADVFIRFVACERGKTPAFASGPFDALDAVVPSRLRDGYELELVIRKEATEQLPNLLPQDRWPREPADPAARLRAVQDAIFDSWPKDAENPRNPEPQLEYAPGQDQTSVFLARVVIPATAPETAGGRPARRPEDVTVDNYRRLFAYPARALAARAGL